MDDYKHCYQAQVLSINKLWSKNKIWWKKGAHVFGFCQGPRFVVDTTLETIACL